MSSNSVVSGSWSACDVALVRRDVGTNSNSNNSSSNNYNNCKNEGGEGRGGGREDEEVFHLGGRDERRDRERPG